MDTDRVAIWNRACDLMLSPDPNARAGDEMLARAIDIDGTFQSGGADAMPEFDSLTEGLQALRWFDLEAAAKIIESYVSLANNNPDASALEEAELRATGDYNALDVSQQLEDSLGERLVASPDSFAPIN